MILGIETSCDDTCAAVVTRDGEIRSNVVASQGLLHARYGGVVPEVASRRHLELLDAVVADALEQARIGLDDVDTIAVTRGPGLIGALLVGVSSAKALAAARCAAARRRSTTCTATWWRAPSDPSRSSPRTCASWPAGGTRSSPAWTTQPRYEVLGQTLDDAAGEAFDKGARLLGLGYPGGPELDRLAREGDPDAFDFPRSAPGELDFSFSGLKTALLYAVRDLGEEEAAAGAPTSPPPTSGRSSTSCSRARAPRSSARGFRRLSLWAAGWPPTPSCGGAPRTSSTRRCRPRRSSSAPTTPR